MSVSHNLTKAEIKRCRETVNEFIPAEQGNKTLGVKSDLFKLTRITITWRKPEDQNRTIKPQFTGCTDRISDQNYNICEVCG